MNKWNNMSMGLKVLLIFLVIITYGLALIPIIIYFAVSNSPKNAVTEIINGLSGEFQRFKLSWSGTEQGLNKLFTEALNQKPTILFIYNGHSIQYKKGSFGGMYDIEILPEYNPKYLGLSSNDIIKDDGNFDIMKELVEHKKQEDLIRELLTVL